LPPVVSTFRGSKDWHDYTEVIWKDTARRMGNFYVIVGSSAGALIGLQFVVIILIANTPIAAGQEQAGAAFATPTIVPVKARTHLPGGRQFTLHTLRRHGAAGTTHCASVQDRSG
jgi:hypothetical protein